MKVVAETIDFRTLFHDQFSYVWNALRRLGVRDTDLEDVTHDVFLRVYRHLDAYDASRPIRPWLFAFAFRAASDHRRLARHRIELLDDSVHAIDPSPPADDRVAAGEDRAMILAALDAIDLPRRAVFILHEVDELTVPDVAATLEIPVNTAYSRLRLAREEFGEAMRRLRLRRGEP